MFKKGGATMSHAYFIAHGAPFMAFQENDYTRALNQLGKSLGKPEAIVVFTAQ
jgi:4,5-DOPA dioxygenase extradiol